MHSRGLTLIELLVTLAVIGIAVSAVAMSIGPKHVQQIEEEMDRLSTLFQLAQDEAKLTGRTTVWVANLEGYRFEALEEGGEFKPLRNELLTPRKWPMQVKGIDTTRIAFGQEPLMAPRTIRIATMNGELRVDLDALGQLTQSK